MASACLTSATRPPPEVSAPSEGAQHTGLRSRAQRHIVGAYLGMRPGGGSGAGSRAGTRAPERRRGDRQGVLLLAERARGGGGRGWRAGHGAARLLGSACPRARVSTAVSRRVQPSSPAARAAAGGLSQHLPAVSHTPLRDTGGFARTRARLPPHAPFGAKKKNQNSKPKAAGMRERGWRRCTDSGVSWQRREVGGRARGSEAKSLSLSGEARSARGEPAGPASGARAAPAAWDTTLLPALPHTSGPLAWGLGVL